MSCGTGGYWSLHSFQGWYSKYAVAMVIKHGLCTVVTFLSWLLTVYSGNFQERTLSQIGEKYNFRKEEFSGLLAFAAQRTTRSQILRRKLSRLAKNCRIHESFLPRSFPLYGSHLWQHATVVKYSAMKDFDGLASSPSLKEGLSMGIPHSIWRDL